MSGLFPRKHKQKKIRNLGDWKKYCRAFIRVAGSLLTTKKIGSKEYATYFWQGIPRTLRARLENRLLAGDPVRDLSEPFEVDDIDRAAEAILQRDRFDRALDDSDSEDEDSSGMDSSSDSDEESSESESDDERERRKRRMKKKTRSRKKTTSAMEAEKMNRLENEVRLALERSGGTDKADEFTYSRRSAVWVSILQSAETRPGCEQGGKQSCV
jgi:hypothetical protein